MKIANKTMLYKIYITLFLIILLISQNSIILAQSSTPSVYAPACILIDSKSGKILYSKNANERMYPASTTKVMTAILALENCKLTDIATVSHNAIFSVPNSYSIASLKEGEELTIDQLLHVLLIPSANDAAFVLAEHIAGTFDSFADMMNKKAIELGCKNTHFVNPNGIHNNNHYSTAYDLAIIGQYAMKFDIFKKIVATTSYTLPITNKYDKEDRIFLNTNELIRTSSKYYYEYATGAKTGYTDAASNCIIASASKNDIDLIAVILHDDKTDDGLSTRPIDCKTLFEYGFNNYCMQTITNKGVVEKNIVVLGASAKTCNLDLVTDSDITALLPNNYDLNTITKNIILKDEIRAPISDKEILGTISYTADGQTYTANLVSSHSVEKLSIFNIIVAILGIIILLFLLRKFVKHNSSQKNKKSNSIKYKNKKNKNIYVSSNYYPKY